MGRMVLGTAVLAVGIAGTALSGCSVNVSTGGPPVVSKTDLEKDISGRLEKAGQKPQAVTCKDDLPGEVGKSTRCEVTLSTDNSFEPVVTVTKVDGSTVSYDMTPAVSKEQLDKAVAHLLSEPSGPAVDSVNCESGLDGKQGAEGHCEVTAAGVTLKRTVEVTKVDGLMMNFVVLPVLAKAQVENSLLDQLATQLGQRPDSADCSDNLEGKEGTTIDCTVVAGEQTQDFTLAVTKVDGDQINFSYQPKA
ncbi:DUF4333 domain-containing protein [Mycolicibacterium sp. CH28]|uniref:DUF4333 domain-containing protein n=1 Tax=Mycolicibacterium sp. CH28 TaxID=2512237 RepID=UPI0010815288|nr:DUF4333 domain-containing protein [Mycolicibacterium sp. CH28]TGD88500.1 DUF4333 domain-containing protein [Mycolicibacterium sp. CH28]